MWLLPAGLVFWSVIVVFERLEVGGESCLRIVVQELLLGARLDVFYFSFGNLLLTYAF